VGGSPPLRDQVYAAKMLVMHNLLSSELHVLASELARIAEIDPHTRDYTRDALGAALTHVVACFPVYRTYITPDGASTHDRNHLLRAVAEARRRSQAADLSVYDFVRDVLLTDVAEGKSEGYRRRVVRLAMKFQQYTAPVTAKGVEDTVFYRFHRLVSRNEVGNDPGRFAVSLEDFHRANQRRRERSPHGLLAGSTHDSKRSEDVRARLHLLSELPVVWRERVARWSILNRRLRRDADTLPDPSAEYLLYQTLLGAWPLETPEGEALEDFARRIRAYMQKAVREAKVHTAWTNADEDYEAALDAFVQGVLDPSRNETFLRDFLPFQRRVARLGLLNSLSQTLLRLTAPGVPDIYQGCELWSFSLVDPDNRRAVDFELRRALLRGLVARFAAPDTDPSEALRELGGSLEDGRAKLLLVWRALGLRRRLPELFREGAYLPLAAEGPHGERLCAYARTHREHAVVALAPRLLGGLADSGSPFADGGWDETFVEVPAAEPTDVLGGLPCPTLERRGRHLLPVADLLRRFPVGLLAT
jgi:(1->4)-alpha-D-glucan 1-alpha-D-glucosylmutase